MKFENNPFAVFEIIKDARYIGKECQLPDITKRTERIEANANVLSKMILGQSEDSPGIIVRIAALEAALRNLVSAVEAARNADDAVCWNPSDETHAAREDAHAMLIIRENEARAVIDGQKAENKEQ